MDRSHRLNFPIGNDGYEALGALTAHYSLAELYAAMLVWHLLKLAPYNGTLLTGNLSFKQRMELAIQIAGNDGHDNKELKEVERLFGKEDGITAKRNHLIHAVWAINADRTIVSPITFSRSGKIKFNEHTTAGHIEEITKEVISTSKRLRIVMENLGVRFSETISFQIPKGA